MLDTATSSKDLVAALRAAAQWLEDHTFPEGAAPYPSLGIYLFCDSKEEFSAAVKAAGPGTKTLTASYANFFPTAGGGIIEISTYREKVCKKVQIGQKWVEPTPAMEIPAKVIPATEGHYEAEEAWDCGSFLEAEELPSEAEEPGLPIDVTLPSED